ncbi:MAG: ester cyclase [Chloroflexota bacterium]|nr:ester cyclase [Chloroflexota bacterium]
MPRRIVLVVAVLVALLIGGTPLVPGLREPASARQASPAAGTPCPATSAEENAALVRRYYEEAYNERNPALAHELLADQFVRHNVAAPHQEQAHGNADDVARVEAWLSAFPDLHVTIEKLIATEDTVVVWNSWRGTQDGPLPQWEAPVTGRVMERESIIIYGVACGQLTENWIVQDNLTMLRQLGIITDDELADAGTPTVATPVP